jgi:hypothetical protein
MDYDVNHTSGVHGGPAHNWLGVLVHFIGNWEHSKTASDLPTDQSGSVVGTKICHLLSPFSHVFQKEFFLGQAWWLMPIFQLLRRGRDREEQGSRPAWIKSSRPPSQPTVGLSSAHLSSIPGYPFICSCSSPFCKMAFYYLHSTYSTSPVYIQSSLDDFIVSNMT